MLRLPSDHERAGVFDLFLEDPTIEPGIRAAFREAIMNGTIPSSEMEYRTATERVLAEGERRGEERGYRQGFEEGYRQGFEEGYRQGLEEGYRQGLEEGYRQGLEEGYRHRFEEGLAIVRRTIIERIRALLGDEAAASLEDIANFDALSTRAFEMLAERR